MAFHSTLASTFDNFLPASNVKIIQRRKVSWLDHAERHFKQGAIYSRSAQEYDLNDPIEEIQMYLCLFSYVGMFD